MRFLVVCLEIIFFCSVSCFAHNDNTKLLFVQILWRHGDRSPITKYPTDPNTYSFWNEGLGKLTLLGRRQQYALGNFFRKMYSDFCSWSPNEVVVISSGVDRCMRSAETNLASFFAPSSDWRFDQHLNWQPIPIEYIPKNVDKYLETDSDCPRATEEQKRVLNSPGGQAFMNDHKVMFEYLTVKSGLDIANWTEASYFFDTLKIEKKYNLTIPKWAEPYWDELRNVTNLSFYWSYNSPLLHRLRAGPLLQRIIETMQNKLAGDIPLQKFQLYSGHDSNIAVLLDALHIFNMVQPPYCSSLIFELHEMSTGSNAVRLLYQNSSDPEIEFKDPHVLVLPGCSEFCPLDYFVNFTKSLMPDDWEKECGLTLTLSMKLQDKNVLMMVLYVMAAMILIMSLFTMWKVYSRGQERYSYHLVSTG